jgi:hypothetical protein
MIYPLFPANLFKWGKKFIISYYYQQAPEAKMEEFPNMLTEQQKQMVAQIEVNIFRNSCYLMGKTEWKIIDKYVQTLK